jgi:hypothetical protein
MINTEIGKKFLSAFNKRYRQKYTAKDFFMNIYYPLFFNHKKYMQWAVNSPFVNGLRSGEEPDIKERRRRLKTFISKVDNLQTDASIAIGYPSLDDYATTSGQITNIKFSITRDDIYYSWIGSSLGVGIQDGLNILLDDETILIDIYEGWKLYRKYLNRDKELSGNKINAWNGQWLSHIYDPYLYDPKNPLANFDPVVAGPDGRRIASQKWARVVGGIARKYPSKKMISYIYRLEKTNTTIGFIPFLLPEITRIEEIYHKIFKEAALIAKYNQVEALLGTAFSFQKACQMGAIGIAAMEPGGLREYMPYQKNQQQPDYRNASQDKLILFETYQIWILAMLKKKTSGKLPAMQHRYSRITKEPSPILKQTGHRT